MKRALLIIPLLLFATFASAQAVMPVEKVSLSPLADFLKPYFDMLFEAAFAALVTWGLALFQKKTGIQLSESNINRVREAAKNAAGVLAAKSDQAVHDITIDVHDQKVADLANGILSRIGKVVEAAGITPAGLQNMIVGELGKQQLAAAPPATTNNVVNTPAVALPPATKPLGA